MISLIVFTDKFMAYIQTWLRSLKVTRPRLQHIQINQHITRHLSKVYSFGNLALDQNGTDREPSKTQNLTPSPLFMTSFINYLWQHFSYQLGCWELRVPWGDGHSQILPLLPSSACREFPKYNNCCVFWPATRCFLHLKAGRNKFFTISRPFLI